VLKNVVEWGRDAVDGWKNRLDQIFNFEVDALCAPKVCTAEETVGADMSEMHRNGQRVEILPIPRTISAPAGETAEDHLHHRLQNERREQAMVTFGECLRVRRQNNERIAELGQLLIERRAQGHEHNSAGTRQIIKALAKVRLKAARDENHLFACEADALRYRYTGSVTWTGSTSGSLAPRSLEDDCSSSRASRASSRSSSRASRASHRSRHSSPGSFRGEHGGGSSLRSARTASSSGSTRALQADLEQGARRGGLSWSSSRSLVAHVRGTTRTLSVPPARRISE
jgi:hypothetical protein